MSTIATDYMELALKLREALKSKGGFVGYEHRRIVADTRELILASRKLQRLLNAESLSVMDKHDMESIQVRLTVLLSKYDITPLFGSVFKLKLPSGETNDPSYEGWCVPR